MTFDLRFSFGQVIRGIIARKEGSGRAEAMFGDMESNGSGVGDVCPEQERGPSTLLLLPLLLSLVWVLVDIFYSSALLGWAVTHLAAFFLTDSAIHLGEPRWDATPPIQGWG